MERSENGTGGERRRSRIADGGKGEWFYRKEKICVCIVKKDCRSVVPDGGKNLPGENDRRF